MSEDRDDDGIILADIFVIATCLITLALQVAIYARILAYLAHFERLLTR